MMYRIFLLLLIFVFSVHCASGQESQNSGTDLRNFRTVQYISCNGVSPKQIMFTDNNADILLNCVQGKTAEQLGDLNLCFTESQLILLKNFRLLREKNDTLYTAFPIINKAETNWLRIISRAATNQIYPSIKKELQDLINSLNNMNCGANAYSILFSYVFDGLVWRQFEKNNLVKNISLSDDKPFWNGVVWSVFPPRPFSCGTNSTYHQGIALFLNWSAIAPDSIWVFWRDGENRKQLLDDINENGRVVSAEVLRVFQPFNLFDQTGALHIPVISEQQDDSLYNLCSRIAEHLAVKTAEVLDISTIKNDFGFKNEQEAFVIVFHEIIWDLMDKVEQNLIQRPAAFVPSQKAAAKDIADLVFIVK